jgi:hypothetical protein
MKASYFGSTRATDVCCNITSLTNTRHGLRVRRHGKSRSVSLPHFKSAAAMRSLRVSRPTRPVRRTDGDDLEHYHASTP